MKIELSNIEIYYMFMQGSSNQKHFANMITKNDLDIENVFDTIEETFKEYEIKDDLRSLVNGGVLYIDTETNDQFINIELKDSVYLIIE